MRGFVKDDLASGGAVDKYDQLKNWANVRSQIHDLLRNVAHRDEQLSIPSSLQLVDTFRHQNVIRCLVYQLGVAGDTIITQCSAGSTNQLNVWRLEHDTRNLKTARIYMQPSMCKILYIHRHRVFVAFCEDMTLRIFADILHGCHELSATLCPNTIVSLAYNKDEDVLLTGGLGCLHRWSMTEFRDKLIILEGYNLAIEMDEWVVDIQVNHRSKQMLVTCDTGISLLNYQTGNVVQYFPNRHQLSLTCNVFYPNLEYFITASKDGSIKVWNSIVLSQMHEFVGHHDAITGLLCHQREPLLLSSSQDGTIRIWRLDTFELQQRIDVMETVQGMFLLSPQELVYWTDHEVKLWNLNLFYHLFTPIQSGCPRLQRVSCGRRTSRILALAEDGGVRVLSPVSGATLTIVYPMASQKIFTDLVYSSWDRKLYTTFDDGDVLVFDCSTNPCQPAYRLMPSGIDDRVLCISLIRMRNCHEMGDQNCGVSLIFSGRTDGTIALLQASGHHMKKPVQAHQGSVHLLASSSGKRTEPNSPTIGWSDRLISVGTDLSIKIWEVAQVGFDGAITLNWLKLIKVQGLPSHVSMLENMLTVADQGKGAIKMYKLEDGLHKRHNKGIHLLKHHKDDDHAQEVSGMDCCQALRLFATAGSDGMIKIWDTDSHLVRELVLDHTLSSLCFANSRGDLVFGYRSHLYFVSIVNYLPAVLLEKLVVLDFQDDVKENPLPFDDSLSLWFDYHSLKAYPCNLLERRKYLQEELLWERSISSRSQSTATARGTCRILSGTSIESGSTDSDYETKSTVRLWSQVSVKNLPRSAWLHPFHNRVPKTAKLQHGDVCGNLSAASQLLVESSNQTLLPPSSQAGLVDKMASSGSLHTINGQNVSSNVSLISETEREPKKWPIAPDGYIPNSVVRQAINYKPPEEPKPAVDNWKLKPAPPLKPKLQTSTDDFALFYSDEQEKKPASGQDFGSKLAEDTIVSEAQEPVPEEEDRSGINGIGQEREDGQESETESVTSKVSDNISTKDPEVETQIQQSSDSPFFMEDESSETPETETVEQSKTDEIITQEPIREPSPEVVEDKPEEEEKKVPERPNLDNKKGSKRKGRRLPKRRSTDSAPIEEDEEKIEEKQEKKDEEEDVHPLLKKIKAESWFPKNMAASVPGVVSAFTALMDKMGNQVHTTCCQYMIEIQKQIGYPSYQKRSVIKKLLEQAWEVNPTFRINAIRTLAELELEVADILKLLPLLADDSLSIRKETAETLRKLTGINNKEALMEFLQKNGALQLYNSRVDEDKALAALAESLQEKEKVDDPLISKDEDDMEDTPVEKKESDVDRVEEWVKTTEGVEGLYEDDDTQVNAKKSTLSRPVSREPSSNIQSGLENDPTEVPDDVNSRAGSRMSVTSMKGGISLADHLSRISMYQTRPSHAGMTPTQSRHDGPMGAPSVGGIESTPSTPGGVVSFHRKEGPGASGMVSPAGQEAGSRPGSRMRMSSTMVVAEREEKVIHVDKMRTGTSSGYETGFGTDQESDSHSVTIGQTTTIESAPLPINVNISLKGPVDTVGDLAKEQATDHDDPLSNTLEGDMLDSSIKDTQKIDKDDKVDENERIHEIDKVYEEEKVGESRLSLSQIDTEVVIVKNDKNDRETDGKHSAKTVSEDQDDSGEEMEIPIPSMGTGAFRGGTTHVTSSKSEPQGKPIDESWRDFYNHPEVQERRRLEMEKMRSQPVTLPPIHYIKEDSQLLPGDAGVRLLQSITVNSPRTDEGVGTSKKQIVHAVPGKLGIHTTERDSGVSRYGILDMRWTTGVPANDPTIQTPIQPVSQLPDIRPGSTERVLTVNQSASQQQGGAERFLPSLEKGSGNEQPEAASSSTKFEWETPIPPPPERQSRLANRHRHRTQKHYCDYYRLMKKRMHDHCSEKGYPRLLPEINKQGSCTGSVSHTFRNTRKTSGAYHDDFDKFTYEMMMLMRS